VVGLVEVIGTTISGNLHPHARHLDAWGYALLLAGPAALLLRHRYRTPVLAATILCAVAYYLLDYPFGPAFLAALVALFGAVRTGRRVPAWVLCAAGYLAFVGFGWLVPRVGGVEIHRPELTVVIGLPIWLAVALALAEAARIRSAHFVEVARTRAEQARARAEQERRQASDERLRIARELHDVLGHHLSLINVQAGVGLHLMDERPEQARTALLAIKQASAEALREVRSVLGVLRTEDEAAPRTPSPSLANLSTLVDGEQARAVIEGEPRPLPAELDRAAYRIAQEALTNVRRHAGPGARATVTIGYQPGALTVRVDDDGRGGPAPEADAGNGIAGMRARASALGGTLTVGPGPHGGFRVEARLPSPEGE
jgi:signal transduction histidine kinase